MPVTARAPMRARFVTVIVPLTLLAILGPGVPLAVGLAENASEAAFAELSRQCAALATQVEPALTVGSMAEVDGIVAAHEREFGVHAAVSVSVGRRAVMGVVAPAGDSGPRIVWPWNRDNLVVSMPVGQDLGVAVITAPSAPARHRVLGSWGVVLGFALLVLGLATVAASALARWVRVPLDLLEGAVAEIRCNRWGGRVELASAPSEVVRLGESINDLGGEVEDRVDRLRSFVAHAGHQLGTPLGTLELCAHNLASAVDETGREDHAMLVDEIRWMAELCSGLVAYARAERPAEVVDHVRVSDIVDSRVRSWRVRAASAGVRLVRRGEGDVTALAVSGAVGQCVDILVDNAVKYAGTGSIVVVAVCRGIGGWVHVDVVDDGPGLPEADLAKAAEPFWRQDVHRRTPGTGLGVGIASTLASAGGGRLTLRAAHPRGVHARLSLRSGNSALNAGATPFAP
jgi:signal transduction histidine kinase